MQERNRVLEEKLKTLGKRPQMYAPHHAAPLVSAQAGMVPQQQQQLQQQNDFIQQ
jgi:hypothetical protein